MIRFLSYLLIVGFAFTNTGCISPLDINTTSPRGKLIVDGFITDSFGPHQIRLTRLGEFAGDNNVVRPAIVPNADVTLKDNNGFIITLNENDRGVYETPNSFKGEVGGTYTLSIEINRISYTSTPQTIPEGPGIDSVIYRFKKLPSVDPNIFQSGVEVFAQWQDPEGENFYLWTDHKAAYQLITRPDLFRAPPLSLPAPKECCAICYQRDNVNQLNVLSDFREDGQLITAPVAFIEDNGIRLKSVFFMELNQFTISREAFDFYNEVKTQLDISGSIFDPPPSIITGNITSTSDDNQIAVGFFGAFKVSKKLIEIAPSQLEERKRVVVVNDDCRTVDGASLQRPDFINN